MKKTLIMMPQDVYIKIINDIRESAFGKSIYTFYLDSEGNNARMFADIPYSRLYELIVGFYDNRDAALSTSMPYFNTVFEIKHPSYRIYENYIVINHKLPLRRTLPTVNVSNYYNAFAYVYGQHNATVI